jgi:hypothetical protein
MFKALKFILIIIALVLIGYGIFYMTKKPEASDVNTPTDSTAVEEVKQFNLKVENRKLVEGPSLISVKEGDIVSIHILSDEAEEFHLHGYDKSVNLTKGVESLLEFTANTSGRFEAELENSKTDIVTLEVSPK